MVKYNFGTAGGGGAASVTYSPNNFNSVINDLFMIGFNSYFDINKNSAHGGFPFFNVSKIDEDSFGIEMALAGFDQDDIYISEHNGSLVITGEHKEDEGRTYLHKGITAKKFTKSFLLAEHVHVVSARMKNGLLQIALKREVPEEKKPKRISIGS